LLLTGLFVAQHASSADADSGTGAGSAAAAAAAVAMPRPLEDDGAVFRREEFVRYWLECCSLGFVEEAVPRAVRSPPQLRRLLQPAPCCVRFNLRSRSVSSHRGLCVASLRYGPWLPPLCDTLSAHAVFDALIETKEDDSDSDRVVNLPSCSMAAVLRVFAEFAFIRASMLIRGVLCMVRRMALLRQPLS
jgi:hypothetical protein